MKRVVILLALAAISGCGGRITTEASLESEGPPDVVFIGDPWGGVYVFVAVHSDGTADRCIRTASGDSEGVWCRQIDPPADFDFSVFEVSP